MKLDDDLEQLLDAQWKKKPDFTQEFINLKATLCLTQSVRNLTKLLEASL